MSQYTEINAHTVLRLTQELCTRTNVIAVRRKNTFCNLRLTFGVWPTWKEAWENTLHYLLWDNFRHKISKSSREFSRLPFTSPPSHLAHDQTTETQDPLLTPPSSGVLWLRHVGLTAVNHFVSVLIFFWLHGVICLPMNTVEVFFLVQHRRQCTMPVLQSFKLTLILWVRPCLLGFSTRSRQIAFCCQRMSCGRTLRDSTNVLPTLYSSSGSRP